jgi:cytochrome d ubiquinol oxidase subunit I
LAGSRAFDINPIAALLNAATLSETLHMILASYAATGILVAAVHAYYLRRDRANAFHRRALGIGLAVGGLASIVQPFSGDFAAKVVARTQPVKLAAMEGQFRTERRAPLRIGGWPDPVARRTRYALEIPGGLSFLATGDLSAEVRGLDAFPRADQPPVRVVHVAFQLMVACGVLMALEALWGAVLAWKLRRVPDTPRFLLAVLIAGPLGMIAIEAGWTVTEVGRQPWIVHGVMRTAQAVTPVPGLWISLLGYSALYVMLGVIVVAMLIRQFRSSPSAEELAAQTRGGRPA